MGSFGKNDSRGAMSGERARPGRRFPRPRGKRGRTVTDQASVRAPHAPRLGSTPALGCGFSRPRGKRARTATDQTSMPAPPAPRRDARHTRDVRHEHIPRTIFYSCSFVVKRLIADQINTTPEKACVSRLRNLRADLSCCLSGSEGENKHYGKLQPARFRPGQPNRSFASSMTSGAFRSKGNGRIRFVGAAVKWRSSHTSPASHTSHRFPVQQRQTRQTAFQSQRD